MPDQPHNEQEIPDRFTEILGGAGFVFLVSYVLTVPARDAWSTVDAWVGEPGLILSLVLVCAVSGALFSRLTGVRTDSLLAGGFPVYVAWWGYLEVTAGPFDSPVHILLGAFFLIGFGLGAKGGERLGNGSGWRANTAG
ncbi:MFS transporter [Natrialba sp. SSL1]|uniref:MFS transporter n=1 Tax=Natrialba sp. SSL1 TaxID=1869245 RepID=UPI0008F89A3C|nr:MFS transporter [Natrialba sp. SSL1]OIB55943.1 MFS transporter [Natrialba sp. SSL1]